MNSRTSTQARSHAQKFFVKLDKGSIKLQDFLDNLDLDNLRAVLSRDCLKDEDAIDEMLLNKNKERLAFIQAEITPKKRRKSNIMNMALTF